MSKVKIIFIILLTFLLFFFNNYCFSQESYVELGNSELEEGLYVSAFGYFIKALDIDPTDASAIEGLDKIYKAIFKMSESEVLTLVNTALTIYPEYSDSLHLALSSFYQSQGLNQKALAELEKIKDKERLFPFPPYIFNVIKANAYLGLGEVSSAQKELERALQLFPDSDMLHSSIANVYASNNDIQKAVYHYQKVLELKPDIKNADQIRQQIESLKNIKDSE